MRYSISPIIEAWISGVLFLITTCLCLFRLFYQTEILESFLDFDQNWTSLFILIVCTLAYSVGWAVNHLAEQLLDTLFQHPFRKKLEKKENEDFFTVRSYVFQYGSDQILNDLKYDRQVIRIARTNCFNFFLMGLIIGTYFCIDVFPRPIVSFFFFLTLGISILSFFQWMSRYKATYKKFYQTYSALPKDKKKPRTTITLQ